ncbi:hypothetical protein ACOMHN_037488 [Nucella lapillus]
MVPDVAPTACISPVTPVSVSSKLLQIVGIGLFSAPHGSAPSLLLKDRPSVLLTDRPLQCSSRIGLFIDRPLHCSSLIGLFIAPHGSSSSLLLTDRPLHCSSRIGLFIGPH